MGVPALPADVRTHVDEEGRPFHYIVRCSRGAHDLLVHFSAFFGEWGNARPYRELYQGYFHRLKMFGDVPGHNWLFLCDEYGADRNGSYYSGESGDRFVERAVLAIVDNVAEELQVMPSRIVTMGSSMGATGALVVGLQRRVKGIVAISPHIHLDIAAARCGRQRHVAAICPEGAWHAERDLPYTRRVADLLDSAARIAPLPALFMQSCADDAGVHLEQVLPFAATWRALGGRVDVDTRPSGGHTSDWATKPLLLDVVQRLQDNSPIDVGLYRGAGYIGRLTHTPLSHRLRRATSLTRRRIVRALRGRRSGANTGSGGPAVTDR